MTSLHRRAMHRADTVASQKMQEKMKAEGSTPLLDATVEVVRMGLYDISDAVFELLRGYKREEDRKARRRG